MAAVLPLTVGAAILLGTAAALLRQRVPGTARGLALLLVLLAAGGALLPPRVEATALATAVLPVPSGAGLDRDLFIAAATAGPRAVDLRVPFAERVPEGVRLAGRAATTVLAEEPVPVDPEELVVVAESRLQVGRPALLGLRLPPLPAPRGGSITVRAPDGAVVLDEQRTFAAGSVKPLQWTPGAAGVHRVQWVVRDGPRRIVARGELTVAAADRVAAVGPRARAAAAALAVQGLRAAVFEELPADLAPFAAVVATGALDSAAQERLLEYLDGGGGVFAIGPALGRPEEPLHAVLPVRLLPEEPSPGAGEGAGEGVGDAPQDPLAADPPAKPPEVEPDPGPPTGDTSEAKLDPSGLVEVARRLVAVVLVIDRSTSMNIHRQAWGRSHMGFARLAALRTAMALQEGDQVGVVSFGQLNQGRVELPMTPATERERIREVMDRLRATDDATFLFSGLRVAGQLLDPIQARVRHVVVLSDGKFHELTKTGLVIETHKMKGRGITTSVIHMGEINPGSAQVMAAAVAHAGGGRYIATRDASKVPRLVFAEVVRSLAKVGRKPARYFPDAGTDQTAEPQPAVADPPESTEPEDTPPPGTEPETPKEIADLIPVRAVSDGPLLQPSRSRWPGLRGLRRSQARLDARTLLVAGDAGHPVLALANRGLGRIAVWTSDLFGPWGIEWAADPELPGRFAQWVSALLPAGSGDPQPWAEARGTLEPAGPRRADALRLARLAGGTVQRRGDLGPVPPRPVLRDHEDSSTRAPWLLGGVMLLALLEALLRRRGVETV